MPGAEFTLQVPTSSPWHGKTLELSELRWYNGHAVAFFVDVADRTAAESLVKAILWVDQDREELARGPTPGTTTSSSASRVAPRRRRGRPGRPRRPPARRRTCSSSSPATARCSSRSSPPSCPTVDIAAGTVTVTPPPGPLRGPPRGTGGTRAPPSATEPRAPQDRRSARAHPAATTPRDAIVGLVPCGSTSSRSSRSSSPCSTSRCSARPARRG